MDKEALLAALGQLKHLRVELDAPMREYTTLRVGGCADVMAHAHDAEALCAAMRCAREAGAPCMVIGNGSNLLVRDGGLRGLVICTASMMGYELSEGGELRAQAGQGLMQMAQASVKAGFMGLEFAAGIPGSVGGALAMNAGAYGGEMSQVLISAKVIDQDLQLRDIGRSEGDMGYRSSVFARKGWVVTSATLRLQPDDGGAEVRMREWMNQRREKQPLQYPSAGSVFKRPPGHFAGALIEQAGLKGASVGGAQVSELHAGFLINRGGATAADFLSLIELVRARVHEHSGIWLELEVKTAGEETGEQ